MSVNTSNFEFRNIQVLFSVNSETPSPLFGAATKAANATADAVAGLTAAETDTNTSCYSSRWHLSSCCAWPFGCPNQLSDYTTRYDL